MILWLHEPRKLSLFERLGKGKDVKVIPPGLMELSIERAAMQAAREYELANLGVAVTSVRVVDFDTLELQTVPNDAVDAMRYAMPVMSPRSAIQISGI